MILYNDGQGNESARPERQQQTPSITPAQGMQQMASPNEYFLYQTRPS